MKKNKLNNEFNGKLQELFIFTKDQNDLIEYNDILRLVEDIGFNQQTLSYHLKYNYCMTKSDKVYYYTGLKLNPSAIN